MTGIRGMSEVAVPVKNLKSSDGHDRELCAPLAKVLACSR